MLFSYIKSDPELNYLTTFIDSNGSATQEIWAGLAPVTDAVMLDLKVFDNAKHIELTGKSNSQVKESIRYLAAIGKLYEVRLLLIPGQNDSLAELTATSRWLMEIDPQIRVKVNAFKSHGVRGKAKNWPNVSESELANYREILASSGVVNLA